MITSLKLLNADQREQLALAIQQLAAVATPSAIYCYAYMTKTMQSWHCTEQMPPIKGGCDQFELLLVLREYDQRNHAVLQEQLQQLYFQAMHFSYKLVTADKRTQLYLSGDRFSADVYTNGVLLYEGNMASRESIQRSLGELANGIIVDWEATCNMARQCILTATRSARKYQYIPAVLMLYKAAVLLTKSIIYAEKKKIPPGIELSRLLDTCESFFPPGLFLFPRSTPGDYTLLAGFEYVGRNGRPHPSGPADSVMVQTLIAHMEQLYKLAPKLLKTAKHANRQK